MKPATVRTSLDVPRDLHRRLRQAAAERGTSSRKLILAAIETSLEQTRAVRRPLRRLKLDPPLVPPAGRRIDLTNDQIYELIEFP